MASKRGNLFEQHVEKLVLLVCVGLLGYLAYGYLVRLPVTVSANGQELGPERVDLIVQEQAKRLEDKLRQTQPELNEQGKPIQLLVPHYADNFKDQFSLGLLGLLELNKLRPLAYEWNVSKTIEGPQPIPTPGSDGGVPGQLAVLPTILPPTEVSTSMGHSYVVRQVAPPAAGGAAAEVPAASSGEETHWITTFGTMDTAAQVAALIKARYPEGFRQCLYLRVELQRSELQADGKWSEPKIITPLPTVKLLETPSFPPNLEISPSKPEVKAVMDPSLPTSYISQICTREYQESVLQPPMFAFVGDGDSWRSPFGVRQNALLPNPPQTVAAPDNLPPTPRPAPTQRPVRPMPPSGGGPQIPGMLPPGIGGLPPVGVGPQIPPQRTPTPTTPIHSEVPTLPPGAMPPTVEVPPPGGEGATGLAPTADAQNIPGTVWSSKPFIWAHDLTVQPGKTYRYRLKVTMYNRLAGLPIRLLNPADARVIEMTSDWSDWSPPVTVSPTVEWYLTGGGGLGGGSASATVFKILPGDRPLKSAFKVEAGQPIGQTAEVALLPGAPKQPVDFSTGAVLLEVRNKESIPQPYNKQGMLDWTMADTTLIVYRDPAGNVVSRTLLQDKANQRLKDLEAKVKALTGPRIGN